MKLTVLALSVASVLLAGSAFGSSHREGPEITKFPKVDNTDVYAFRSYEPGRDNSVTILANFQPFQDPYGGPQYFLMDQQAVYDVHIDNNGDAMPDITYEFRFFNQVKGQTVPVNGVPVFNPLAYIAPVRD
ncbi:MAG: DUF4331 domain-containing protein, partial [Pseudomonadota bacterium]|nr:DUF4331 domain-containing protein [Pseudomonadota bacterium]